MTISPPIHATCVAIDGVALLITGPSGAGKSDLALRLIDRGAVLVSDDYTQLRRVNDILSASAPSTILGKIEVRGIGIIDIPTIQDVPVKLMVEISPAVERYPVVSTTKIDGIPIAWVGVAAHEASAPVKVELALKRAISKP
jgi:serine kinase of HPr protein (carbohydrate metabolism regulator)